MNTFLWIKFILNEILICTWAWRNYCIAQLAVVGGSARVCVRYAVKNRIYISPRISMTNFIEFGAAVSLWKYGEWSYLINFAGRITNVYLSSSKYRGSQNHIVHALLGGYVGLSTDTNIDTPRVKTIPVYQYYFIYTCVCST